MVQIDLGVASTGRETGKAEAIMYQNLSSTKQKTDT